MLRLVNDWLRDETNGRWLMVLDNVDDIETFFPSRKRHRDKADQILPTSLAAYLPQSRNGSVLITSRNKDAAARLAGGYHNITEVLAMDESQGLQLLCNKLVAGVSDKGAALDLLRVLDCMPLAITQAAAYINRRVRMTIAGYLREFRASDTKRESLLNRDAGDLRRDESASNSIVTTWQMSFERIRQERRSAAELLSLMSFFNPQGIPESTLRAYARAAAGAAAATRQASEDEADSSFDEDLDTLHAYSLVAVLADNGTCEIHALVQFCTRVWLTSSSEAEQWQDRFVQLMAREFPSGAYEDWVKCQQLLPHVELLYEAEPDADGVVRAWAQVLTIAAWYLCECGDYRTVESLVRKAFAATHRVFR